MLVKYQLEDIVKYKNNLYQILDYRINQSIQPSQVNYCIGVVIPEFWVSEVDIEKTDFKEKFEKVRKKAAEQIAADKLEKRIINSLGDNGGG